MNKKALSSVVAAAYLFISTPVAFAQTPEVIQIDPPGNIPTLGPGQLISFIINAFFGIAILAALIYLLWGGLNWILSGGDKDKIEAARSRIVAAIIGLVLVVLSYFILDFVLRVLGMCGISNFQIPTLGGTVATTCPNI